MSKKFFFEDNKYPSKNEIVEISSCPNSYKKTFILYKCLCGKSEWKYLSSTHSIVCNSCQNSVFLGNLNLFEDEFSWEIIKKQGEVQYKVLLH